MEQDLKAILRIVEDGKYCMWIDRFFFDNAQPCRMVSFIEGIQKGDVSKIRQDLEKKDAQMNQAWEQHLKSQEEDAKREELLKAQQRERIPSAKILLTYTVPMLKDLLRERQLSLGGKKQELIQRLVEFKSGN